MKRKKHKNKIEKGEKTRKRKKTRLGKVIEPPQNHRHELRWPTLLYAMGRVGVHARSLRTVSTRHGSPAGNQYRAGPVITWTSPMFFRFLPFFLHIFVFSFVLFQNILNVYDTKALYINLLKNVHHVFEKC